LLVRLHLAPIAIKAKTFYGETAYAPIWGALPLIEKGFYPGEDLKLTKYIADTLKPGQVFIDGGANYGWYSLLANALGAKVYSFEPTNKVFKLLAKNAEGKNITATHAALWSSVGEMQFNDFGDENNVANTLVDDAKRISRVDEYKNQTKTYMVPTATLDSIPKADFIKLDCEGVEYEILSAVKHALDHKPILAVEILDISRKNGMGKKVVDLLAEKGYDGHYITDDFKLAPLSEKGEAAMVNAIFLPRL
jgi:FkbM family methyltransferase